MTNDYNIECCENSILNKIDDVNHAVFGQTSLLECKNCDSRFCSPTLSQEEFVTKYVSINKNLFNNKKMNLLSRSFFINYSRFDLIKKFLNLNNKNNILEIGSGYPGLYDFFKESNQNFFISEKNNLSVSLFDKLNIENINIDTTNKKFDLIMCNNLIYYIYDLYSYLNKLKKILVSNNNTGFIFIDILNSKTIKNEYFHSDDRLKNNALNDQVAIYSKKSINYILKKSGFKILFSDNCSVYPPDESIFKNENFLEKIYNKFNLVSFKKMKKILINDKSTNYANPNGAYLHIVAKYQK